MILTTPIGLNCTNLSVEKTLHMSLKDIKNVFDIRFMLKEIDPVMVAIVINKTNIILITSRGGHRRTPNICVNKLKRCMRNTSRIIIRKLMTLGTLTSITDDSKSEEQGKLLDLTMF